MKDKLQVEGLTYSQSLCKAFPSYNLSRQRARRESPDLQHSDANHVQAIWYQKDIGKLEGIQENIVKQLEGLIYKERLK